MEADAGGFFSIGEVSCHGVAHHVIQVFKAIALGADTAASGVVPPGDVAATFFAWGEFEGDLHGGVCGKAGGNSRCALGVKGCLRVWF